MATKRSYQRPPLVTSDVSLLDLLQNGRVLSLPGSHKDDLGELTRPDDLYVHEYVEPALYHEFEAAAIAGERDLLRIWAEFPGCVASWCVVHKDNLAALKFQVVVPI